MNLTERARQLLVVATCDHGGRVSDALASFGFCRDDLTDLMLRGLVITRKNHVYSTLAGQRFLKTHYRTVEVFEARPHI